MRRSLIATLACVLFLAGGVVAEDIHDAPWQTDPTDPAWEGGVPTHQEWSFDEEPGFPCFPADPGFDNPFGCPTASVPQDSMWEVGESPTGEITGLIYLPFPGTIDLQINNNPEPLERKELMIQITSSKAPGAISSNPPAKQLPGAPGPSAWMSPPNPAAPDGQWWYTYTSKWEIRPNPDQETISIDFPAGTYVEEIVVDTICVPEPATMALLAVGGLAGVIRKRR